MGKRVFPFEAGLMDMLQRMESGRFKVFKHLNDWFEEFRLYHRKDDKVVKEGDDLMAATRYAICCASHRQPAPTKALDTLSFIRNTESHDAQNAGTEQTGGRVLEKVAAD